MWEKTSELRFDRKEWRKDITYKIENVKADIKETEIVVRIGVGCIKIAASVKLMFRRKFSTGL